MSSSGESWDFHISELLVVRPKIQANSILNSFKDVRKLDNFQHQLTPSVGNIGNALEKLNYARVQMQLKQKSPRTRGSQITTQNVVGGVKKNVHSPHSKRITRRV